MPKDKTKNIGFALKNRFVEGYRFDNSKYWKKYYLSKLKNRDLKREKRYANFLVSLVNKNSKVLDVATGYGFLPLEIAKLGLDVTCCDVFDEMLELAQKYFSNNDCQKIKLVKSDVISLPFKKNSFDLLTAMSILEHLTLSESSKYFIPTIKKIVKKGGYILVHVPVRSYVTNIKKIYRQKIIKDIPTWAIDDDGDVTHKIWFSVEDYFNILLNLGLKPRYITFNFRRSNERLIFMRWLNSLISKFDGKFYDVSEEPLHFSYKLLSKLAVSCAFVCQN